MKVNIINRINAAKETQSKSLDLRSCDLKSIPDVFNDWKDDETGFLNFIDFSDNDISGTQDLELFSRFNRLNWLRFDDNKIDKIISSIPLQSLQQLDLSNNYLKVCPKSSYFPVLQECNIDYNPINVDTLFPFYLKFKPITVFISYNHEDNKIVNLITKYLTSKSIKVRNDQSELYAGKDLVDFIEEEVENANYTLSIISEKSLLSSWVALETLKISEKDKTLDKTKWLPFAIDTRFQKTTFVDECIDTVVIKINEIGKQIKTRIDKDREFPDLNTDYHRFYKLKNNLPGMVHKIKTKYYIDASDPTKMEHAIHKIYDDIKESESRLRNLKINKSS